MYQVTNITEAIGVADLPETISYNAAQQPIHISQEGGTSGNTNLAIQYGADQQRRYAQLSGNGTSDYQRYYVGDFERNIKNGVTQDIHSIAPGVIIVGENNVYSEFYTYSDHLGSINVVTDDTGDVVARQSFDAWGRKRNATDWTYDNVDDYELSWLHRGYTGHEMLPEFGLINMNGRLYDNYIGRMLSPDEYAGYNGKSQSYNRYSYAFNNPLKFTDPTGEVFIPGLTFQQSLGVIQGVALQHAAMQSGNIAITILGRRIFKNAATIGAVKYTAIQQLWQSRNNPAFSHVDRTAVSIAYGFANGTNTAIRTIFGGRGDNIRSLDGLDNTTIGSEEGIEEAMTGTLQWIPVGRALQMLKIVKTAKVRGSAFDGVRNASNYLKEAGVPRLYRKQILQSFDIGTISLNRAGNSTFGLRFYDGINASAKGRYLFPTFSNYTNRSGLALPQTWNKMTGLTQFQIRPGSNYIFGRAASQGGEFTGGSYQMYVNSLENLIR